MSQSDRDAYSAGWRRVASRNPEFEHSCWWRPLLSSERPVVILSQTVALDRDGNAWASTATNALRFDHDCVRYRNGSLK